MNRQSLILAAALLLVPLTAPAGESIQLVDVKTTKAGHEQVWIRLQPHQARALRLKHRVSKRQTRWSGQDKHRAAPIELDISFASFCCTGPRFSWWYDSTIVATRHTCLGRQVCAACPCSWVLLLLAHPGCGGF